MSEQRQRVRFTGKRTGRDSMPIKGVGVVEKGDVIEVSLEEAERWTEELPTRDGETASDFVKVGGTREVDEDKVAARRELQREKGSESRAEYAPDVPEAHETHPETGTVEEFAEVVTATQPEVTTGDSPPTGKSKS